MTFRIAYGGWKHVRGSTSETNRLCLDSHNDCAPFLIVGPPGLFPLPR